MEDNFDEDSILYSYNIDYIRHSIFIDFLNRNKQINSILEIGPGHGFLASYLANFGYKITVIEHPDAYIGTKINNLKDHSLKFGIYN